MSRFFRFRSNCTQRPGTSSGDRRPRRRGPLRRKSLEEAILKQQLLKADLPHGEETFSPPRWDW